MSRPIEFTNVLGVPITATNMSDATAWFDRWIAEDARAYVSTCTAHLVMECLRSSVVRDAVCSADMVTPDGRPLVWISWLHGLRQVGQVCGPDLLPELCRRSVEQGYSNNFFGGTPALLASLIHHLQDRFPGLPVVGALAPPIATSDELCVDSIAAELNDADPDILWVGLGAPKQDLWIANMRSRLNARVVVGVGAAFDFNGGSRERAPRWVAMSGFEWLYRLAREPRRLWRRYLLYNPWFVAEVGMQALGLKHYSIPTR